MEIFEVKGLFCDIIDCTSKLILLGMKFCFPGLSDPSGHDPLHVKEAQDLYRLEPKKKLRTLDDEDDFEIIEREKEQEADTRNYYTMEEVAARAEVSRSAVNKWCIKGMIQHYRYGRSIRIPKKEFDEWLKTQKIRKRKK